MQSEDHPGEGRAVAGNASELENLTGPYASAKIRSRVRRPVRLITGLHCLSTFLPVDGMVKVPSSCR